MEDRLLNGLPSQKVALHLNPEGRYQGMPFQVQILSAALSFIVIILVFLPEAARTEQDIFRTSNYYDLYVFAASWPG